LNPYYLYTEYLANGGKNDDFFIKINNPIKLILERNILGIIINNEVWLCIHNAQGILGLGILRSLVWYMKQYFSNFKTYLCGDFNVNLLGKCGDKVTPGYIINSNGDKMDIVKEDSDISDIDYTIRDNMKNLGTLKYLKSFLDINESSGVGHGFKISSFRFPTHSSITELDFIITNDYTVNPDKLLWTNKNKHDHLGLIYNIN